jgi:hypothetical protein
MKHAAIVLSLSFVVLAGGPSARAESSVPAYVNGTIIRVGQGAVTIREGDRDSVLAVDPSVARLAAALHPGDAVILTCRTLGEKRVVTDIRNSAPSTASTPAGTSSTILRPARVVSVEDGGKKITVVDPDGQTRAFPVHGAGLTSVQGVSAGDSVALTIAPMAGPGGKTTAAVVALDAIPAEAPPVVSSEPTTQVVVTPGTPPAATGGGVPLYPAPPIPWVPNPAPTGNVVLPPAASTHENLTPAEAAAQAARGLSDLQAASVVLAAKANEMDRGWEGFREEGCLAGPDSSSETNGRGWFRLYTGLQPPDRDACRRTFDELMKAATAFRDQVDTASRTAQKAGVLPGRIREVLQHENIDLE